MVRGATTGIVKLGAYVAARLNWLVATVRRTQRAKRIADRGALGRPGTLAAVGRAQPLAAVGRARPLPAVGRVCPQVAIGKPRMLAAVR
ncbi:MAG TPA: hypothetical protein VFQ44_19815 [Streptosporangiaceae bacterium]|nr:hypothetical protein [Streptosporangiaceae bacterium]